MRFSALALALPVLFVAAPAAAHDKPAPSDAARVAQTLSNPMVQEGIAALAGAYADAVLDTHVGPLARYADPRDQVRPEDTLGDLVRRRDPDFARHLHDRTRAAVARAGQTAGDVAAMSSELQRTSDRLRKLLDATSTMIDQARQSDR